jgi:hypothetical protein
MKEIIQAFKIDNKIFVIDEDNIAYVGLEMLFKKLDEEKQKGILKIIQEEEK